MTVTDVWIDLLDPTSDELDAVLPPNVHDRALEQLLRPTAHDDEPRPKLESHGDYVFGVFLIAVVRADGSMYYEEVNLVMTRDQLVTIRKTPGGGEPAYDIHAARGACRSYDSMGMVVYHIVDDVAERFLSIIDNLDEAIEELEDRLETWKPELIRRRVSDIKHDILTVRRTLVPYRELVRRVIDNRTELDGEEVFPHDVELSFASTHDKFLRATDGLDVSRELLAGVRDHYQTMLAARQNDISQRMTAIASLLLMPTFIVGLYGQNFVDIPELHWHLGYAFSWALILLVTVGQLVYFRRKHWV